MKPTAGDSGPFLTWVVSIRPRLRSRDVRRTSGRPYLEVGSSTAAVPKMRREKCPHLRFRIARRRLVVFEPEAAKADAGVQ